MLLFGDSLALGLGAALVTAAEKSAMARVLDSHTVQLKTTDGTAVIFARR